MLFIGVLTAQLCALSHASSGIDNGLWQSFDIPSV